MTRSFFSMVGIAGGIALVTALKIGGLGFVNQTPEILVQRETSSDQPNVLAQMGGMGEFHKDCSIHIKRACSSAYSYMS